MSKVQGVGINDLYGWATRKGSPNYDEYKRRVYTLWKNMLRRCYSKDYQAKYPTYQGCSVCSDWLTLSKFAKAITLLPGYQMWKDNPNQKITLDKDILIPGNKEYKPDACQFVTLEESITDSLVRHPRSTQVARESKLYKVKSIDSQGNEYIFSNLEEASIGTGVSKQSICDVIYGRSKRRKGFIFIKL